MTNMRQGSGILDFFGRFPNEDACLDHVANIKWGPDTPCTQCGNVGGWRKIRGTKKWWHPCRKQFSPLKDTIFYRSNLSLLAWFYAIFLFSNSSVGMRMSFIRKQLGLGQKSAFRVCGMIRVHMASMPRPEQLGGPGKLVHVDEVYLKYLTSENGGSHEAAIVLGIACEGKVICGIVPDRKATTIVPALLARIRPGSTVVTDMHLAYRNLERLGYAHIRINHSVAFHDFNGTTNNEIEAFWATVKRYLNSYRQVSRHNLWTYLAEIEFHYNRRRSRNSVFDELVSHFPTQNIKTRDHWRARYEWGEPHDSLHQS